MIRYRREDGRCIERREKGELRDQVLQALKDKPWQTKDALIGREHNSDLLRRLMARGVIQRRVGDGKRHPFEYALAGEPNTNPPRERPGPREPVPCKAPAKCLCGACRPWCRKRSKPKKLDR